MDRLTSPSADTAAASAAAPAAVPPAPPGLAAAPFTPAGAAAPPGSDHGDGATRAVAAVPSPGERRPAPLEPGVPWPMGACADEGGVNFCVFSAHAARVELCLFDAGGEVEMARLALPQQTGDVWHGRLRGARPGLVYGYRVHGPWRPDRGHRFNPHKLLLDPWAREIVTPAGGFDWDAVHLGADALHPLQMDTRDNARGAHKARVVADLPADDRPRRAPVPLLDTVIYELHVRGFTRLMPGVPAHEQGTYAGLASDAALAHLGRLGVTTLSLLPVQQILDEGPLRARGLTNYWGYNTLGFFCPDPRYAATGAPRQEFRAMVRRLHDAGIEVLLDVVYNHTPEGDERGATLSWRGFDNASWYRLPDGAAAHYENYSGCGNTLDVRHPRVLQMVLDSLRFWAGEMGVDGFRFDLAPVLGRASPGFERDGPFFKAVLQDPVLQRVKLVAEPWDLGPGGYQVGQFPRGWLEWNDRFRDGQRAFWLGGDSHRGEWALRLAGSSDLFQARRRSPLDSVNYVVSHDGFTLADLVSYEERRNEANGEGNRDGHGHNLGWNCGVEGPSDDAAVLERRSRLQRALLASLLLAQGTPMLCAGSEMGHTQHGNNNPYCQDNAVAWLDWSGADQGLIDFVAHLLALRRRLLPLDARWYTGLTDRRGRQDLAWLRPDGQPMTTEHWQQRQVRVVGASIGVPGRGGDPLLLLANARDCDAVFELPPGRWVVELDSTALDGRADPARAEVAGNAGFVLPAHSFWLLRDAMRG